MISGKSFSFFMEFSVEHTHPKNMFKHCTKLKNMHKYVVLTLGTCGYAQ